VFKAERRIAEFVDAGQADGTIAGQATHGRSRNSIPDGNTVAPATLPSLGLTAKQVHEARKVAGVTDADIDAVAAHGLAEPAAHPVASSRSSTSAWHASSGWQ
jgi:hypothetical protein